MRCVNASVINFLWPVLLNGAVCGCAIAESSDIWRARAAAAIAIHNARADALPRPSPPSTATVATNAATNAITSGAETVPRKVVTMYTATWCAPCQRAKAELQQARLPFDLKWRDVSQGGQPDWCESIPAFAWEVNGRTRYVLGFPGIPQLVSSWEQTQQN